MIEAPGAIGASAARQGRTQRDDARDPVRLMLRIFAGLDAAEAPADERRCSAGAVDDPLDAAVGALDDVGRRAPVELDPPAIATTDRTPPAGATRTGRTRPA